MSVDNPDFDEEDERGTPGPDEAYCMSCGEIIKAEAEVCPECGVRQQEAENGTISNLPDAKQYELEKIANKDTITVMLVSFLLTPIGYYMVGKTGLAIINFLTLNYLLLGPILVPFHTRKIIKDAREELLQAGVEGY
ncbi:zinc ribbon domain-containing protein [Halosolutus gelatinilyticus]|uniref:zinc ribbon domain-containing protein n=1 Tax=Halosolutus gelatinilyticus TaxID=2931975 RepID=UPI001FF2CF11|nr:zinc ribbon domain-containing protein [Halosolutus gelatinilyticus]